MGVPREGGCDLRQAALGLQQGRDGQERLTVRVRSGRCGAGKGKYIWSWFGPRPAPRRPESPTTLLQLALCPLGSQLGPSVGAGSQPGPASPVRACAMDVSGCRAEPLPSPGRCAASMGQQGLGSLQGGRALEWSRATWGDILENGGKLGKEEALYPFTGQNLEEPPGRRVRNWRGGQGSWENLPIKSLQSECEWGQLRLG